MALAVAQSKTATANAASVTVTFDSAVAVNSLILAAVSGAGGVTSTSVTDNSGTNSYTEDREQTNSGGGTNSVAAIWSAINGTSGAHQVTFTPSAATVIGLTIVEVTGAATSSITDGSNGTEADDVTSHAAGAITTTNADDILMTCISSRQNTAFTADGNYTGLGTFQARHAAAYRIVSATGTYDSTWTLNIEDVSAVHVAYKAAAAGGGRTTKNIRPFPLGMDLGMGLGMGGLQ